MVAEPDGTQFRGLLEATPDAMVIVGENGRIALVNGQAERLFGYTRDELYGQLVEILVPERFQPGHPADRASCALEARLWPMGAWVDLVARRKDGTEFPAEISLSRMDTERGRLIIIAIRDVTARREVENALKVANRELEAFSYSVADNLRAPLRGVSGFAQMLLDNYRNRLDPEARNYLGEILSNVRQMSELIDALVSLSRGAWGKLRRERVDLTAIVRASVSQLAAAEPHRSVTAEVADGLWVDADPDL